MHVDGGRMTKRISIRLLRSGSFSNLRFRPRSHATTFNATFSLALLCVGIMALSVRAVSYKVSEGGCFTITASDASLESFDKKPKVVLMTLDQSHGVKVLTRVYPADQVVCQYGRAGLSAGTYSLLVEVRRRASKTVRLVSEEFVVLPPADGVLTPNVGEEGDEVVVSGDFFGMKPPKVSFVVEEGENGEKKTCECRVLKPFAYVDGNGREGSSCMDLDNGASEVRVLVPKGVSKQTQGAFCVDNGIGTLKLAFNQNISSDDMEGKTCRAGNFSCDVAYGSILEIRAEDVDLESFEKKPVVFYDESRKRRRLKLKTKDFPADSVFCQYKGKTSPGTYGLYASISEGSGVDSALVTNQFEVVAPSGDGIFPCHGTEGDEITITGDYFGVNAPKVTFIPSDDGTKKDGDESIKCSTLKPYAYPDEKGREGRSCMDVDTGDSEIRLLVPRGVARERSGTFVVDNGVGKVEYPFNQDGVYQVGVTVTPDGGGLTEPENGEKHTTSGILTLTAAANQNWTFAAWTAEPAEFVVFEDASSADTRATINGDAEIIAAFIPAYSISGTIGGDATEKVTVTLSGNGVDAATKTDAEGAYVFEDLLDGDYTVTPSYRGHSFFPGMREVIVSGDHVKGVDFTSSDETHVVSGTISGDAVENVTVRLLGEEFAKTTTDAVGQFTFTNVVDGNYQVAPVMNQYVFEPEGRRVVVDGADVGDVDFVSTADDAGGLVFAGQQLAWSPDAGKVSLAWAEAADDLTEPADMKYYVFRGTEDDPASVYVEGNLIETMVGDAEVTLSDQPLGATRYYLVVAEDEDGNRSDNRGLSKVVVNEKSVMIESVPEDLSNLAPAYAITTSDDGNQIVMDGNHTDDLAAGELVLVPCGDGKYLKKITAISYDASGGTTSVSAKNAPFDEAVSEGNLNLRVNLSSMNQLPERDDAKRKPLPPALDGLRARLESEGTQCYVHPSGRFIMWDEGLDSSAGGFRGKGSNYEFAKGIDYSYDIIFDPGFDFAYDWSVLNPFLYGKAVVSGKLGVKGELKFNLGASYELAKDARLFRRSIVVSYWVGVPPAAVYVYQKMFFEMRAKLEFNADASLNFESKMELSKEMSLGFEVDTRRDDAWKTISEDGFTRELSYSLDDEAGFKALLTVYPVLGTTFYGVATGEFQVEPALTVKGELELTPRTCFKTFDVDFLVQGKVQARLEYFRTILKKVGVATSYESDYFNIVDPIKLLSLPSIKFTTAPTSGDANSNINFSAEVTEGTNNPVSSSGINWCCSPENSLTSVTPDAGRLNALFKSGSEGDYVVTAGARGDNTSFLGELGEQQVDSSISIGPEVPGSYTVSGTISGGVKDGVKVSLSSEYYGISGTDGDYSITGVPDGTYAATPSRDGCYFDPSSKSVTVDHADVTGVDFISAEGNTDVELVVVESGVFQMGDRTGDGYSDELPVHEVEMSTFKIGKYEITNDQVKTVFQWAYDKGRLERNDEWVEGNVGESWQCLLKVGDGDCQVAFADGKFTVDEGKGSHPCVEISWQGATAFCNYLSEMKGLEPCFDLSKTNVCDFTKNGYRLPTEAEWEKAARGGNASKGYLYSGSNNADDVAWYNKTNSTSDPQRSEPVGTKAGNELGIHDMSGNVREFCHDYYLSNFYSTSAATEKDPKGPSYSSESMGGRCVRGGSWYYPENYCRCARRGTFSSNNTGNDRDRGFRVATNGE